MTLLTLAFLAGMLTILAPCILPVIPFVFSRMDGPFRQNGLPTLVGLSLSFAAVATLAVVGGAWAVQTNEAARWAALLLLAVSGVSMLAPGIADRLSAPVARLGQRLLESTGSGTTGRNPALRSFLTGTATGLLWAPCAGPILGLVLTAAVLQGASAYTSLLLFSYAAGAATSLAAAVWASGRVFRAMSRSMKAALVARRALGAAVLAGVVLIALGLDTQLVVKFTPESGNRLEELLLDRFAPSAPQSRAPELP